MLVLIGLALRVFCLAYHYFLYIYHYFVEGHKQLRKLVLKNSSLQFLRDTSIYVDCVSESLCKSFEGGPSYGNYQPAV